MKRKSSVKQNANTLKNRLIDFLLLVKQNSTYKATLLRPK